MMHEWWGCVCIFRIPFTHFNSVQRIQLVPFYVGWRSWHSLTLHTGHTEYIYIAAGCSSYGQLCRGLDGSAGWPPLLYGHLISVSVGSACGGACTWGTCIMPSGILLFFFHLLPVCISVPKHVSCKCVSMSARVHDVSLFFILYLREQQQARWTY